MLLIGFICYLRTKTALHSEEQEIVEKQVQSVALLDDTATEIQVLSTE